MAFAQDGDQGQFDDVILSDDDFLDIFPEFGSGFGNHGGLTNIESWINWRQTRRIWMKAGKGIFNPLEPSVGAEPMTPRLGYEFGRYWR